MHGVFSALLVLFVLLFLTASFRAMPNAVLASIVFMAVKSLFDLGMPRYLRKVKRADFVTWVLTFGSTLLLGVQVGISFGSLASMVALVVRSARPNHALLGKLPGTDLYRDIRRFGEAQQVPGVIIFRFDASLHFANKDFFRSALLRSIAKSEGHPWRGGGRGQSQAVNGDGSSALPNLHSVIVIDFSSINDVDISALRTLSAAAAQVLQAKRSHSYILAMPGASMRRVLRIRIHLAVWRTVLCRTTSRRRRIC